MRRKEDKKQRSAAIHCTLQHDDWLGLDWTDGRTDLFAQLFRAELACSFIIIFIVIGTVFDDREIYLFIGATRQAIIINTVTIVLSSVAQQGNQVGEKCLFV